jgi:iron complex outermembrane recepter protein
VRANADIFYQSFDNFIGRFEEVPYLGPGPSVQSGGFTYPGDATVQGFETDVTADVTDNWWVQVSSAYAEGNYDDASVPCRDTDKDGNPDIGDIGNIGTGDFGDNSVFYCTVDTAISSTPEWVANLQSEYTFPLFSGEGYVRGLFNYYAKQQDTGGFRPDPYSVLNLYVGMRGPDNQWDIGLWTKNVFDENNQLVQGENQTVFSTFQSGYHQAGYVPEREVGLTLRYLFGNG